MIFAGEDTEKKLNELLVGFKRYLRLKKGYAQLELVEKLSIILAAILLVFVLVMLGMMFFFYLLITTAYFIAPHVGGMACSYAIITLFILLVIGVVYLLRERLIKRPIVRFIAKLFLSSSKK